MESTPTLEQQKVLDEDSNCIVIARPGSGKTFILSHKIKALLDKLPHYKGVIAISFTNKASDELERRCFSVGIDRKSSFFGTIDSFFISEIVIPFGQHLFGNPEKEISVVQVKDIEEEIQFYQPNNPLSDAKFLGQLYSSGKVVLDSVGFFATYVFDHSHACRRYLKARYSHVLIDEYQDCGDWQHELFLRLMELKLGAIAVGDLDQSIFAFAGKNSKFLSALAQDNRFRTYSLSKNHRCHQSIVNYATRLISATFDPIPVDDIRVYEKRIDGSEIETAQWLSSVMPKIAQDYQVENLNGMAILVKNTATRDLIHQHLEIPHKSIITTVLDEDSSLWGSAFRNVLTWVFSAELTKHELVERYLKIDHQVAAVRKAMRLLRQIEEIAESEAARLRDHIDLFIELASILLPRAQIRKAVNDLEQVLDDPTLRGSFVPAQINEVQLMTLHKAKSMEFDVVFHLNLHRWILPQYKGDRVQDLNLHYVGLTRARKCCTLCISTERHRDKEVRSAEDSEFLHINGLNTLRAVCPY